VGDKNVTEEDQFAKLRKINNPNNELTGHHTGRCARCSSKDLWHDVTVYGCECCGAVYFVGALNPKLICNFCFETYEMGEIHVCPFLQ